jgi:hypothetical protein
MVGWVPGVVVLTVACVLVALGLGCAPPVATSTARGADDRERATEAERVEQRERAARENAQIAESNAQAERANQGMQAMLDDEARRDAEARRQASVFSEVQASEASEIKANCLLDVAARAARQRAAQAEIVALEAKEIAAEAWVNAHCKSVEVPTIERQLCDDGSAVAKICNVETGFHDELRCPPGAPRGVTKFGIEIPEAPAEIRGIVAFEADTKRNRQCGDVPGLVRRGDRRP